MSSIKQKKRSKSESLAESGAGIETDSSPKKKQKKVAVNVEEKTSKVNGSSEATAQLTASQRKRLKSKQRKLKAIEKIKAEGGTPKSLWAGKKVNQAAKVTEKGAEGKTTKVEKKKPENTLKTKEKRAEKLKARKEKRLSEGQYKVDNIALSPDEIRLRIEAIKGRAELTKTARRKLAIFQKKLAILEGVEVQKDNTGGAEKKSDAKGLSKAEKRRLRREKEAPKVPEGTDAGDADVVKPVNIHAFEKKKAKLNKAQPGKVEVAGADKKKKQGAIVQQASKPGKKIEKKGKSVVSKSVEDEDEDDDDEEAAESESENEDEAAEVEEGEDSEDDDDDEEEEDDEEEDDEEESDEEEEAQSNGFNSSLNQSIEKDADEEEEEDEDEEEEEDEDEDEEEDDNDQPSKKKAKNASKPEGKQKKEQQTNLKKQEGQEQNGDKKKRYVLFVGNIPFDSKPEDLEKHFLTKVSEVTSVRIPTKKGTQIPRGFAYVEVTNNIDYEKGLSLHHSTVNGRRINVEYTLAGSKQVVKRQELVSKNQKLHAMRKAGQLAGSQKHDQKRSVRRFKKKEQERKPN